MKRVLVFAAHPDDEVLGCGGTVARHVAEGDEVRVVVMAEGITSRGKVRTAEHMAELEALKNSASEANRVLGVKELIMLDFPDNRMDSCAQQEVRDRVADFIRKFRPQVVYTHHIGDVNVDHRITHEAVVAACRPDEESDVQELYFFETASSTEWFPAKTAAPFLPAYHVEITRTLGAKLKSLEAYASEMREFPHPRSIQAIEHLARWRGATVGVPAAEAFSVGFRKDLFK